MDPVDLGSFINGRFEKISHPEGEFLSLNPTNPDEILGIFSYSKTSVDHAIEAAKKAFPSWAALKQELRLSYLEKFSEIISKNQSNLSHIISKEIGKPLWEANQELTSVRNKFSITMNQGMRLIEHFSIPLKDKTIKGTCHFKPRGPLAVIAPFNFPLHLALGHIIPALATGNTVILKPSEMAPKISQNLCKIVEQAHFPPGVFNMVQGEAAIGKYLCEHEYIKGVLFTGSYKVGNSIAKILVDHPQKILALEMGGKNTSLIWEDADLKQAASLTLQSATITTGQRCTGTSKLLVHEKIWPNLKPLLINGASQIQIGDPFDDHTFMGPIVNENAKNRFYEIQEKAKSIGAKSLLSPRKQLPKKGYFVYPTLHFLENFDPKNSYCDHEFFAPDLAIYLVKDLSEAIQKIEASRYGLSVSIFTKSKKIFNEAFAQITAGVINWNRPTTGASSQLPFGGQKASGNDFPTALFAPYYCTYPVSSMMNETANTLDSFPGFPVF